MQKEALLLNFKIKSLFISILFLSFLYADEYYIQEPILNSQVYINVDGNIENEPIVFVHGLGDEASTIWQESILKLKDNYYVISFDLPGFGKSSKENVEYTPEKYAQILDFLVSKFLENREFYLVGHSMGGAISLKYTMLYQERVKKLMLIDSAGVLHKDAYGEFMIKTQVGKMVDSNKKSELNSQISKLATDITSSLSSILPKDLSSVVRDERYRDKFLNSPTSIAALGLITEDWFDIYKIKTPTFILWGENDEVTPLRSGYVLNFLLDNSELYTIKYAGHVPILNNKEEYFSYLDEFFVKELKKSELEYKNSEIIREISNKKGELKDCSYKSLKIKNSNNLTLFNCNIEKLIVENSNVNIINSNIISNDKALIVSNSNIEITSSNIKAQTAIESLNSKLDIAGTKIEGYKSAITSLGENEIIFSLTTILSPNTKQVFHKKESMKNNQKY
ncbi:hypothetical protein CRU89_02210 [Aliarcobacter trophiarum]|nr:hypothetical protein CRU89_02210 [Aliarcobacter trophiarum]